MAQTHRRYSIRQADEHDQPGILHCLAAAFEPYRKDYTAGAFADTVLDAGTLPERMRRMCVLVATFEADVSESIRPEPVIVGTVAGAATGDHGHLRGMAVLPQLRGTGLAGQLLSAIEAWLGEQGCKRVTLDTMLVLKAAMRFYEKNGYVQSGRNSDFFGMTLVDYVKVL